MEEKATVKKSEYCLIRRDVLEQIRKVWIERNRDVFGIYDVLEGALLTNPEITKKEQSTE